MGVGRLNAPEGNTDLSVEGFVEVVLYCKASTRVSIARKIRSYIEPRIMSVRSFPSRQEEILQNLKKGLHLRFVGCGYASTSKMT